MCVIQATINMAAPLVHVQNLTVHPEMFLKAVVWAAELSMRRPLVAVCETGLYHVTLMRHLFPLSLQEGQRLRTKLCS